MQKSISKNCKDIKEAFSVAEMLLVLLILSFLVLALPPIVHKKVEKRVTRGEHGRYECWRDPNNNLLYEYYATEKNGIAPGYTETGKQVTECTFSPKEQAPNAAYFSFQVIGGGAGGTYPPYDPNDTTYRNPAYTETADVRLGTGCCSSYDSYDKYGYCNYSQTYYYDYKFMVGTQEKNGNGSAVPEYLGKYCWHYKGSLEYWARRPETKDWIYKYWLPVKGTGTIKFCSGKGFTGAPDHSLIQNFDPEQNKTVQYYRYHYGGQPGNGACWQRDASSILLDTDQRYKVVYSQRTDAGKYFYGYDGNTSGQIVTSWEYKPDGYNEAVYGPDWTTPSPQIDLPARYGNYQVPVAGGGNTANFGQFYSGNYVKAELEGGGSTDSCIIGPGRNGVQADRNSILKNFEYQNDPSTKGADSPTTCQTPWVKTADVRNVMEVSISNPSWPSQIIIKRSYGYDTPTMGYAGTPGTSVNMFLSKLQDDLSFEIGSAGAAGTAGSKRGGNGGDTIVRSGDVEIIVAKGGLAKNGGEMGRKVFMFGRDSMFGRNASERVLGPSVAETQYGFPYVKAQCEGLGLDPAGEGQIDGCLDKIVARDNPKRFAVDSEFYTILELDPASRTPSAIYRLYNDIGENLMPGSAGDGGYSFLRSTTGTESVTYQGHPTAEDWVREYEYEYNGPYTCYKRNDAFGAPTGEVVNAPGTVCKPTRGYPGAVVIVW